MAKHRKLGRRTDQRVQLIYSQASQLLWHGRIETTLARQRGQESRRKVDNYGDKDISRYRNGNKDEEESKRRAYPRRVYERRPTQACRPQKDNGESGRP